jgi:sulfite exporter TauE/SafE
MNDIWTGLVVGVLGSLHCVGMCGPLAMALPPAGRTRPAYFWGRVVYNFGRVITYAFLGTLFGLAGKTFVLAGAQRWLSIGVGVAILLAVLIGPRWGAKLAAARAIQLPVAWLKTRLARLLHRHSAASLLAIGILNGFLPCGLVYVALAGAAATGHPVTGAAYMAAFGVGTFALMLPVSLAGKVLQTRLRLNLQRAIPIALIALAALFILRGLSLGIPYLSPDLTGPSPSCH